MIRHFYSVAVVLFFLAMMSLLARDHILPWIEKGDAIPVSMAQVVDSWSAIDDVFAVRLNGQLVGYLRIVANQNEDGFEAFNIMAIGQGDTGVRLETATLTNPALELTQAALRVRVGDSLVPFRVGAMVDGGVLRLRTESTTGVRFDEIRLRDPITMNFAVEPFIATNELAPGERYAMNVYDPLLGAESGRMMIEMTGTETIVTESQGRINTIVVEVRFQGQTMRLFLDEDRLAIRREIRFGGEGSGPAGANIPEFRIRMDRLEEGSPVRQREDLRLTPERPAYSAADLQGENTGDPISAALSFFPQLLGEGGLGLFSRPAEGTP